MHDSADVPSARELRTLRLRFVLWSVLMVGLLAVYFGSVLGRMQLETDLLALLPQDRRDPAVDLALREYSERAGRKTLFLVGAADEAKARNAAEIFAAKLRESPGFADVQLEVQARFQDTLKAYRPYRAALLSAADRTRLQDDDAAVYRDALRALYTPAGLLRPTNPAEDPLGLLGDFLLAQVPALGAVHLSNGVLAAQGEGKHWVLVIAETRGSPFATATQAQAMPAVDAAIAAARADGAEVLSSGLLRHAAYGASSAHREVATFGTISLVGTLLLLLFVHRSIRPVLMSAGSIALGFVAALVACQYLFGRVHLLTLVFGSSLIGVAADYSTYFLTDAFRVPGRWEPRTALKQVAPGILLGLATTLLGYAPLIAAPFPALRQIATFSAVGLVTACGCVLCLFPLLKPPQAPVFPAWLQRVLRALLPQPMNRAHWLALALLAAIALAGLPRLKVQNDIRLLQASPPELIQGEQRVRALMGNATETQFFLVSGADPEEVLEREEALRTRLDALQAQGAIASYAALTRALPSKRTQDENARLMAGKVYAGDGLLPRVLKEIGFDHAGIAQRLDEERALLGARLSAETWLRSAAADSYRHLWLGRTAGGYATVVGLGGIRDLAALAALDGRLPGVRFVDKVHDISRLLARYQVVTAWIVVLGHLAVWAMLAVRYGLGGGLRVLSSSAGACLVTLGLFGLSGEPVNLFTLFALLLVLGIGIDYAIFLREGRNAALSSLIAVLVCAATTLLSFGILAFSRTPFIHSLGLTLLLGISTAFLIARLSALPSHLPPLQASP